MTPLLHRDRCNYAGRGELIEDLVQVANLGGVKAALRYDDRRGTGFATYARPVIMGELRRHFRGHVWPLHVPRSVKDRAVAVAARFNGSADEVVASPLRWTSP